MSRPNAAQVLRTLNSICYRIHMEPMAMRSHMDELTALLNAYDPQETTDYSWLEVAIRQAQLNLFKQESTQDGFDSSLCLLKLQGENAYNLCFANDVDECICQLWSLCKTPVELVACGKANVTPEIIFQVLSEPEIQQKRWFPLNDIEIERIVRTLGSQESVTLR
ncbi:hypothetical protein L1D34_15190 [Vibrio mediterranei]|uniref:hypothetical protein n=1 Tax=Vibrio mediterranei TaxID=689 RepID=UPI001EFECCC7|nr:hypothetical protein [Vibrio mediterranei]MCG9626184.1 hypothetical protein [Vibrio mediterranei]